MADNYVFEGKDLGIMIGGNYVFRENLGTITIYNPKNDLIPHRDMSKEQLRECVAGSTQVFMNFNYVDQILVNNNPAPVEKGFWGRGDIRLELNSAAKDIGALVEKICEANMGLKKVE